MQREDADMASGQSIEHLQNPYESLAEYQTEEFKDGLPYGDELEDMVKAYIQPPHSTLSLDENLNVDITMDTLPEPMRLLNMDDDPVNEHQATISQLSNTTPSSAHTTVHIPPDIQLGREYLASTQRPPLSFDRQEPSTAPRDVRSTEMQDRNSFNDWDNSLRYLNACLSEMRNITAGPEMGIKTGDYHSIYPTHSNPMGFSNTTSPTMSGRRQGTRVPESFPGEYNLSNDPFMDIKNSFDNEVPGSYSRKSVPTTPGAQSTSPSYNMNYSEQSQGLHSSLWPDYTTQSSPCSTNLDNPYTPMDYECPENRSRVYGARPSERRTSTRYSSRNTRTSPNTSRRHRYRAGRNDTYVPSSSRFNMFTGKPFKTDGNKRPHEAAEQHYEDISKRARATDSAPSSENYSCNSRAPQSETKSENEDSELEVYDISEVPGVETLLLRPSTCTTAAPNPTATKPAVTSTTTASAATGGRGRPSLFPDLPNIFPDVPPYLHYS
ncbi:hypothetical protein F4678DRAFT_480183 [Xylaria arbuscula]|nr:hypothetical protein F4678DRAFT_480183 [Xylaria arbuscula]